MQLIIGGAFQGKKEYVKTMQGFEEKEMTDGADASYEDIFSCGCLYHFHEWIRARLLEGRDLDDLEKELSVRNPDIVLVSNELGMVWSLWMPLTENTGRLWAGSAQGWQPRRNV